VDEISVNHQSRNINRYSLHRIIISRNFTDTTSLSLSMRTPTAVSLLSFGPNLPIAEEIDSPADYPGTTFTTNATT
jgi:hypothetical protein